MQLVPKIEQTPQAATILEKITLDVGGMKCAGCVKSVERQISQHPGVKSVVVNLATEVAVVESFSGVVDPDVLANLLTASGFPTQPRRLGRTIAGGNYRKPRRTTAKGNAISADPIDNCWSAISAVGDWALW